MMFSLTTSTVCAAPVTSSRTILVLSVFVFFTCLVNQQHSVAAQWLGQEENWRSGGGEGFGASWMGGEDAEEWQEEMEERGGTGFGGMGSRGGGMAGFNRNNRRMNGASGAGSAEAGGSRTWSGRSTGGSRAMEMPSWMTFLQNFLRVRIEQWRQQQQELLQQQQQPPQPPQPQNQSLPVLPQSFPPESPVTGGPLARNIPDILPDATIGLFGIPMGMPRARGDSPVIEPTTEPVPLTPEPETEPPVLEPEPVTIAPPTLPRRRGGSSSSSGVSDFRDMAMSVVDNVIKPAGAMLQDRWECRQQGGVCAPRCENPADIIDIVDCGMGPRGRLSCCEQ
ncbi:hypothetical protein ElyMa_004876700 [Elysia marginata]|uniref:Uncharacterized protein n=1 Tax=Elysia marginata TaxID=1093978 RepID=A0AAV4IRU8_9GAST|nr:hypothetical protein ElyMa_004876700 [Elysia marginata]